MARRRFFFLCRFLRNWSSARSRAVKYGTPRGPSRAIYIALAAVTAVYSLVSLRARDVRRAARPKYDSATGRRGRYFSGQPRTSHAPGSRDCVRLWFRHE